jgi:hypothetical protein
MLRTRQDVIGALGANMTTITIKLYLEMEYENNLNSEIFLLEDLKETLKSEVYCCVEDEFHKSYVENLYNIEINSVKII